MSTLLICCGENAPARLSQLRPHLPLLDEQVLQHLQFNLKQADQWHSYNSEHLAITVCGNDGGITESQGVMLVFEGFVTCPKGAPLRGEALRLSLISDYLKHGENCAEQWRGSFRVVIYHQGITRIYTDQLASRALFYINDSSGSVYSSHTAPLLEAMQQRTIDGANLLQFLNRGRFFAGATLFKELRQLQPGCGHRITEQGNTSPSQFTWYQYQLQNLALTADEILPRFKTLLDSAILQHWQRADGPALILSGGVDSRYILNTLGQLLPTDEFHQIFTCLWAEPNPSPDSDAAWALREAERHQVPFEMFPVHAPSEVMFEAMFAIQSGMTAHVFSHCNDLYWCRHMAQQGNRALIRGDEIFGPNGDSVSTREQALARVGLGALPDELTTVGGFNCDVSDWRQAHFDHIDTLAQIADEPNDLRDLLYCCERLPAFNTHLNSHRAPFVENFNPLLDKPLLDFTAQLPRHLRTDKSIFRQCFARYYPTKGFATSGNGFNWQRLWTEPGLAGFIQKQLTELPAPFDAAYWHKIGQLLDQPDAANNPTHIATMQLAGRVIVLGRWLK